MFTVQCVTVILGQCLMSSMIGGRSGNRGQCAQPCRLPYSVEGKKPQDLMSLKDLCTIEMIPDLIEAGIDSFKIEGTDEAAGICLYGCTDVPQIRESLFGRKGAMVSV